MSGIEVYSDDFTDSTSGWSTGTDPKGAVFAYAPDGYTVTSTVAAHWLAFAPYDDPAQQVNLNMTAHESASPPTGAGFGLLCTRGPDSTSMVRYEFIVNETNRWFIERNQGDGDDVAQRRRFSTKVLCRRSSARKSSRSPESARRSPTARRRDSRFSSGRKRSLTSPTSPSLDGGGWLGGLISSGDDVKSTTTVAGYTESDLGNDGILAANT